LLKRLVNVFVEREMETLPSSPPKLVFLVPYRDREPQKYHYLVYMTKLFGKEIAEGDYQIYLIHQQDKRPFNRGAMKNIGFQVIKNKFPNHYLGITLVFQDLDTLPYCHDLLNFETRHPIVKHFYGFTYALGGMVSITGEDMEKTNGFPNFWGWGMEDTTLQKRCEKVHLYIDRSQFYRIGSPEIIHLFDGVSRIINKKEPYRGENDDGIDGIHTITSLTYEEECTTTGVYIIHCSNFLTRYPYEKEGYHHYDLRDPPRKILHPNKPPMMLTVGGGKELDADDAIKAPNALEARPWTYIPDKPIPIRPNTSVLPPLPPKQSIHNPIPHPRKHLNPAPVLGRGGHAKF
jgi:hypothetical protein